MKLSKNPRIIVPLTGGLGNQLFQLAFALHQAEHTGNPFYLEHKIANPRMTNGETSILQLGIDSHKFPTFKVSNFVGRFYSKLYGWNLVNGISRRFERNRIIQIVVLWISTLLFSFNFRLWLPVTVNKGLGYDERVSSRSCGLFIGYFQTYIFAQNKFVFSQLMKMRLLEESNIFKVKKKKLESESRQSILLHVRLTDYISEDKFGVPSEEYYVRAIRKLRSLGIHGPIWVFSDDLTLAKKYVHPLEREFDLRMFNEENLTDVENWLLMRKFGGYVIGNSSYSWWAAFLRENQDGYVCYPEPWFSGMSTPREMFPDSWIPIPAGKGCPK